MKSPSKIIGENILFCFARLLNKYTITTRDAWKMEIDTTIDDFFPDIWQSKEQQMLFDNVLLELSAYCSKTYDVEIIPFKRLNGHLMFNYFHDVWLYHYEEVARQLGYEVEEAQK